MVPAPHREGREAAARGGGEGQLRRPQPQKRTAVASPALLRGCSIFLQLRRGRNTALT